MIRLILLTIVMLLSLLTVFHAPAYYLWLIAILVTEFPVLSFCTTTVLLIWGFWVQRYRLAGTLVGLIALVFFSIPVIQSYQVAADFKNSMRSAFPSASTDLPVLNLKQMVLGRTIETITRRAITYSEENLKLDFYPSASTGKHPCVLVVHGGSWKSGDNKQLPELNAVLATNGYHVAAINYRLAPAHQSPVPVEDVRSALLYLRQHAEELRIDTSNFVLLGRSAGAQIALLAAYTLNHAGVKGVISFYGPADMVWGYSVPSNPLVMNSRKVMEDYLGGTYNDIPGRYLMSSPLNFVSKTSVPTLIIHGENDVLVAYEHSIRLQKKLSENGVRNYFLSLPWATHGFDYTINGPGGQLSTFAVCRFLESVFRHPSGSNLGDRR